MSKTILCADDSATMQKVAEITFAATEFKYVGARTVDEALRLARAEKPVLVLADAVMPGKNGYDLCRLIKSDAELADIPVLIMCGNSQAYDATRGEPAGADGQVTKPWDTQVMHDRVAETLAKVEAEGAARLGEGMGAAAAAAASPPAAGRAASRAPTTPPVSTAPPARMSSSAPPLTPGRAPSSTPGMVAPVGPQTPLPLSAAPKPGQVAPASALAQPPRSATIMGMPAFPMPPGDAGVAAPVATVPATAPTVRAAGSSNDTSPPLRPPMIKGMPQRRLRLVPISEMAAQVASEHGLALDGPEMQALLKLSREVVERIVWEVVPELAEAIIKHNLDRLTARAGGR